MINQKEIDINVELYFFNPNKCKDDFIDFYKSCKFGRYQKEKGYRYSPLFLIQKDIRFCFGIGKQFNYIPRIELDPANFAGVILIHTAFNSLVKRFYSGDYPRFAKQFMDIDKPKEVKALDYLRHALVHNNYSLSWNNNGIKFYFILGIGLDKLIEKVNIKTSYLSEFYQIDVRKLMTTFEQGVQKFKKYLLDRKNHPARKLFIKNFDVDTWIFINNLNS